MKVSDFYVQPRGLVEQLAQLATTGRGRIRDGVTVVSERTGDAYVLEHVNHLAGTATIRRAIPKVKGKAARKADKRARRTGRPWLL